MNESMYVDKFYHMDPEHEDLLADGTQLKDGMVVLISDHMMRADMRHVERHPHPYQVERAFENNRWCVVSDISIKRRFYKDWEGNAVSENSPLVSFVATYADGTKIKRIIPSEFAWIVKKDSLLPENESYSGWDEITCSNPECPQAGRCGGKCAEEF